MPPKPRIVGLLLSRRCLAIAGPLRQGFGCGSSERDIRPAGADFVALALVGGGTLLFLSPGRYLCRLYAVFVDINRIPAFELNRINRAEWKLFVVRSNASIFGNYAHYPRLLTGPKFLMSIGAHTNDIVIIKLIHSFTLADMETRVHSMINDSFPFHQSHQNS